MAFKTPQDIAQFAADTGQRKASLPWLPMLVLGFFGGAYIALGFLLDIRVTASLPKDWGTFGSFLGAAVFPVGLILIVLGGGELITGNMMAVTISWLSRKTSFGRLIKNFIVITVANFVGALFVAYFFGHVVGLTETGAFLTKTTAMAHAKLADPFWHAFVSGIGCNWMVAMGVWLAYGAEDGSGKILGIWFPIMAFVAIGFQHVVANMFLIPAAIFAGTVTWAQYLPNFVAVWLGNLVGGGIFVAFLYYLSYLRGSQEGQLAK